MPIDADHVPAQSHWNPRRSIRHLNRGPRAQCRPEPGSGATALVVVPLAGVLAVLAAVIVVNATNDWWTLGPAMLIALVATACVLGTVVRMLADND